MKKNVVLVGMMGSGKTTLGKRIANHLGMTFVDMDLLIEEKLGKKISTIFSIDGESYFRSIETEVLQQLSENNGYIISTGGGVVLSATNRELLKNLQTIYLEVSCEELSKRLQNDTERPLLRNREIYEVVSQLYRDRKAYYEEVAEYTVNLSNLTEDEGEHKLLCILGD